MLDHQASHVSRLAQHNKEQLVACHLTEKICSSLQLNSNKLQLNYAFHPSPPLRDQEGGEYVVMTEGYIHFLHGESASDYPWSCILTVRDRSPASCLKYESMEKYRDSMGLLHGGWEWMLVITPLGRETTEDIDVKCINWVLSFQRIHVCVHILYLRVH